MESEMTASKHAAQRRSEALRNLRRAAQTLSRACDDRNAQGDLESEEPLYWAYAIGAAQMSIWQALAQLGDPRLLNEWNAKLSADRASRLAKISAEAIVP
jgi:hypothetical protein